MTGYCFLLDSLAVRRSARAARAAVEPGRTTIGNADRQMRMLLSFQRPPRLVGGDSAPIRAALRPASERAAELAHPAQELGPWPAPRLARPKRRRSIALPRRNVTVGRQSTRRRRKRRLPTCSTRPSSRSPATSSGSRRASGSPSSLTPPCVEQAPRLRARDPERARRSAPAGARSPPSPATARLLDLARAARARRTRGRSAPRPLRAAASP